MSQVLSGEQSLDAPSRYTLFERDVFGASSPKRPPSRSKKQDKSKKLKRFSKVAFAGESPNLEDVSSGILSKSKKSVLSISAKKNAQPSTSRQVSQILFQNPNGSSTPSLLSENGNAPDVLSENIPEVLSENVRRTSSKLSPVKSTQDPTIDLLTTESFMGTSAVINGQPNVLRIDSTPDAALPAEVIVGRLSRNQQIELSVRKTREWLNSIPDDIEPVEPVETHDNSLISTISRRSDLPADHSQDSVLVVAPHSNIREVRILLQRLDPQLLLRIPIQDIQNLMKTPSNLTMPQVQKTMNNLLLSNKIGLTTADKRLMKSIECNTVSKKLKDVPAQRKSPLRRRKPESRKRKLFTGSSQPSDVHVEIGLSANNVSVHCPYTPPTVKKTRTHKKTCVPVQKKKSLSKQPTSKTQKKSQHPPKRKMPPMNIPPKENLKVVRRTRSSDLLKAQRSPEKIQSKTNFERNPENIPTTTRVRTKSHEMTLRKKSNPRRTSLFFQPKQQIPKPKRTVKRNSGPVKQGPKVVCTFLHRGEVDTVGAVIKRLGGMMESKVSAATTHVVCGGPKRTINLLRGIARGCWLVTLDWVIQSGEKKQWIDEEPYEITNFSSAVQKCRIARQTLGIYPTIFEKVGTIYVSPRTSPPKSDLSELLKLCGARVVKTTRRATVAVGAEVPGVTSVSELWVLDCIQENILLPLQRYVLENHQNS